MDLSSTFVHLWQKNQRDEMLGLEFTIRRARIYRAHSCIRGKKIIVAKKIIVKKCWATNAQIRRAWIYRAHLCICGKKISVAKS